MHRYNTKLSRPLDLCDQSANGFFIGIRQLASKLHIHRTFRIDCFVCILLWEVRFIMLSNYGNLLPIRTLEEISSWKRSEMKHANLISQAVPLLEEPYIGLMGEWAALFDQTNRQAQELLQQYSARTFTAPDDLLEQTEQLLLSSCYQSREFIKQLTFIKEISPSIRQVGQSASVFDYALAESEHYLTLLGPLNYPGEIEKHLQLLPSEQPSHMRHAEPSNKPSSGSAGTGSGTPSYSPVPIGGHVLPPLPYPFNALEPYIDEKTMRIHHNKHHQSYVDGLNKAEKKLAEARKTGNFELVKHWERELAFHGSGHNLHTIFWTIMNPEGGGEPQGPLAEQIQKDFGSFAKFKKHFSEAAEQVEGGGWAILTWSPRYHRLEILQAEKHQNLTQWESIPLLPLDVWEHAYYLKHQNKRVDYIEDWWNVVYWPAVQERYLKARELRWLPY